MSASRFGRLGQMNRTNFPLGIIPGWLSLREDTATWLGAATASPSNPGKGINLISAAGASKGVSIIGPDVDLTAVKMVRVQVVMTGGGDNTTSAFLGIRNPAATRGGGLGRNANNGTVYLRGIGSGGAQTNKDSTYQAWESTYRQNLEYRLFPNETDAAGNPVRKAYLFMDDQQYALRTFTDTEMPLDLPVCRMEFNFAGSSSSPGSIVRTIHSLEYEEVYR